MDWNNIVLFFIPACFLFFIIPSLIWLSLRWKKTFTPSGIKAVRWYPGANRERIYEFAEYEDGWDGLMPGHEEHITGWHRGNNPYLYSSWESTNIPFSHGWENYEDYINGQPPKKLL